MVLRPVRRFSSDIHVLTILTKSQNPPFIPMRPKDIATALYVFVDESGSEYGRLLQTPQNNGSNPKCIMWIWEGLWERNTSRSSSNNREFWNLVKKVEDAAINGQLNNAEVFVFTENSVIYRAYSRVKSKRKILFQLVLRLQKIKMEVTLRIQVTMFLVCILLHKVLVGCQEDQWRRA